MPPLLKVEGLKAYFQTTKGYVRAVDGISFELEQGEAMGLAGESGCGKSSTALTIMRLLPSNGKIRAGRIMYKNSDLIRMDDEQLRKEIRWKTISIVFQGAMNSLNPVFTVGNQIVEAITLHEDISQKKARKKAGDLLELVGINRAIMDRYPHELSGGMRQRAMISMALACDPKIVIADEPTTALDVIVQAQVLKVIKKLQKSLKLSLLLISHDLSIIAETCDKVAVMYAGKFVELADVVSLFKAPLHPYTQGLIAAFPKIDAPKGELMHIPGSPPDLIEPPSGCRFHPRCKEAGAICSKEEPAFEEKKPGHFVACHMR
jgi:peptide/nickel transport system ATP-binding protein